MIYISWPWKLSNFQDPLRLSIYIQNSSTPLTLGVQFQTNLLPQHSTNDNNQLKENIIQRGLLYVIRSFFQVGFHLQYQLINFVCLSSDFFSFTWSLTICLCVALYSCVVQKYHEMSFICNYSYFKYILILQSTSLISTTWKLKQTIEEQPRRAFKQTK